MMSMIEQSMPQHNDVMTQSSQRVPGVWLHQHKAEEMDLAAVVALAVVRGLTPSSERKILPTRV
jgi:hypothetical protein